MHLKVIRKKKVNAFAKDETLRIMLHLSEKEMKDLQYLLLVASRDEKTCPVAIREMAVRMAKEIRESSERDAGVEW